ncbi:hypothetical protein [Neobacillus terrae]|uniref:hypothetical protein n=1 Tax=Neobacillus terrae TaxID=3034837 RepID=UPI001FB13851|nr:hypothetical protein [Neobacillus terrae]
MSKILLTSQGFFTDEIKQHFIQLLNKPIANQKAAIITTVSIQKEHNKFALKGKRRFAKYGITRS